MVARRYALLALLALGVGILVFASPREYPEAATIGDGARDFKELSERFETLAKERGGVYAFEVLRRAELPPGTDLHLLGHVVGDELYRQEGTGGIAVCTQDFRNACSHSIVIGALNEYGGDEALDMIREACKKAPGGSGAYTMCYHGLGHGVFVSHGYDFPETLAFCKKTGTEEYRIREYEECVGGAVMELGSGGGHDRAGWLLARARYFDEEEPLAPCSTPLIPDAVKGICYIYLTPRLFEAAGGDLGNPEPRDFEGAFAFCDTIPSARASERGACFSGIGKEFPVLAVARDVRLAAKPGERELRQMREWCALAPHEEAYSACAGAVLTSLFWGGETDPRIAARFCEFAPEFAEADECFALLFDQADTYLAPGAAREALCGVVPAARQDACRGALDT